MGTKQALAIRAELEAKSRQRFILTGKGYLESHEWAELIKAERVLAAASLLESHQPIWSE